MRNELKEKLNESANFHSFDIEIIHDSIKKELEDREEANLRLVESYEEEKIK